MKCFNCYYYKNIAEIGEYGTCISHIIKTDWNGTCNRFTPKIIKVTYDKGRDKCIKCNTRYTKAVKTHYFRKGMGKVKVDDVETKTCSKCNHICFDDNNFRYIVSKLSENR